MKYLLKCSLVEELQEILHRCSEIENINCSNCPFDECYDRDTRELNQKFLLQLEQVRAKAFTTQAHIRSKTDAEINDTVTDLLEYRQLAEAKKTICLLLSEIGYFHTAKTLDAIFVASDMYQKRGEEEEYDYCNQCEGCR